MAKKKKNKARKNSKTNPSIVEWANNLYLDTRLLLLLSPRRTSDVQVSWCPGKFPLGQAKGKQPDGCALLVIQLWASPMSSLCLLGDEECSVAGSWAVFLSVSPGAIHVLMCTLVLFRSFDASAGALWPDETCSYRFIVTRRVLETRLDEAGSRWWLVINVMLTESCSPCSKERCSLHGMREWEQEGGGLLEFIVWQSCCVSAHSPFFITVLTVHL